MFDVKLKLKNHPGIAVEAESPPYSSFTAAHIWLISCQVDFHIWLISCQVLTMIFTNRVVMLALLIVSLCIFVNLSKPFVK